MRSIEAFKFIDDMPRFFANADLLLCRSGASTVAEITAAGKPAIFVPFPRAADDHQKRNAEALERAGAAIMLEEARLIQPDAGRNRHQALERSGKIKNHGRRRKEVCRIPMPPAT